MDEKEVGNYLHGVAREIARERSSWNGPKELGLKNRIRQELLNKGITYPDFKRISEILGERCGKVAAKAVKRLRSILSSLAEELKAKTQKRPFGDEVWEPAEGGPPAKRRAYGPLAITTELSNTFSEHSEHLNEKDAQLVDQLLGAMEELKDGTKVMELLPFLGSENSEIGLTPEQAGTLLQNLDDMGKDFADPDNIFRNWLRTFLPKENPISSHTDLPQPTFDMQGEVLPTFEFASMEEVVAFANALSTPDKIITRVDEKPTRAATTAATTTVNVEVRAPSPAGSLYVGAGSVFSSGSRSTVSISSCEEKGPETQKEGSRSPKR